MTWLLASFGSALMFAAVNLVDKIFLVNFARSARQAVTIIGLFSIVCFLGLFLFSPVHISTDWLPAVLSGFFEIIYIYYYLLAISQDEVGFLVPLFGLSPLFAFILSSIFFKDPVSAVPLLGVMVISASIFALHYARYGKITWHLSKPVALMIVAAILYAGQSILLDSSHFGLTVLQKFTVSRLGVVAGAFIILAKNPTEVIGLLSIRNYVFVISETLYLGATYLLTLALALGNATVVLSALNVQPLFVLVASYWLYKKRPDLLKEKFVWEIKWLAPVAIGLIGAGVVLLEL